MSSYRHLIVCAILFFVLFYGFANFAKAEPIPTDCDYEHVAMLFGARAYDYWTQPVDPWMDGPPRHVITPIKNSTFGLPYESEYNLVHKSSSLFSWLDRELEVIDMRDIARAIRNYQKSQST